MSSSLRRLFAADAVDAALAPAIRARTTAEWVAEGDRRRIPITPMPTPGELPTHEHWVGRGSFGPIGGTDTAAPTLPFDLTFHGAAVDPWPRRDDVDGPLSGLRVVDFTMGWAGPFATRMLGDLGADVVKVESVSHPDWWRGWEPSADADPPLIEVQPHFNAMNRNKRGVSVDLQTAEGQAVARALIERADVVIDNYAAGVLDKLGLGHDAQRALRPDVVSVSMPAFGTTGPLAGLRAYGSTVEQASGLPWVNGHAHWPPSVQHVAFGDPIAGLYGGLATLAALAGRQRHGASSVELAQVACLFELCADAIVAAQVDGEVPRTGSARRRLQTSDVFAAADERWVAVATDARTDDDVRALVAGLDADDAAAALRADGVAAAVVVGAHELGHDQHLRATGFWQELERVHVGVHPLGAPAYRIDGARPTPRRPAPVVGEHTAEVLAELDTTDEFARRAES
jgi:crotonobetainyl-CoA:carnitine CoA-transferase CaiB-like acyl-CoA transferase